MEYYVGNKGVISKILPDDEMPTILEGPRKGDHVEICINPLGKHYAQVKSI